MAPRGWRLAALPLRSRVDRWCTLGDSIMATFVRIEAGPGSGRSIASVCPVAALSSSKRSSGRDLLSTVRDAQPLAPCPHF